MSESPYAKNIQYTLPWCKLNGNRSEAVTNTGCFFLFFLAIIVTSLSTSPSLSYLQSSKFLSLQPNHTTPQKKKIRLVSSVVYRSTTSRKSLINKNYPDTRSRPAKDGRRSEAVLGIVNMQRLRPYTQSRFHWTNDNRQSK